MNTLLVNQIISLERPLEKILKKGEYVKCDNTPDDNDSGSYKINLPNYGGGSPKGKDKLLKALDHQSISSGLLRYTLIERLLTGDTKATFHQAVMAKKKININEGV